MNPPTCHVILLNDFEIIVNFSVCPRLQPQRRKCLISSSVFNFKHFMIIRVYYSQGCTPAAEIEWRQFLICHTTVHVHANMNLAWSKDVIQHENSICLSGEKVESCSVWWRHRCCTCFCLKRLLFKQSILLLWLLHSLSPRTSLSFSC